MQHSASLSFKKLFFFTVYYLTAYHKQPELNKINNAPQLKVDVKCKTIL